jgi:hypothetical protein
MNIREYHGMEYHGMEWNGSIQQISWSNEVTITVSIVSLAVTR